MKLCIFDFDGTLFESPTPNRSRLDKKLYGKLMAKPSESGYGWFQDPVTLAPDVTTDLGYGFKADVVEAARKCIDDSDCVTVMMTGRSVAFADRIIELCASEGLVFDEYILKPDSKISTGKFKENEISRLLAQHSARVVEMWEDRQKHVKLFDEYLRYHHFVDTFKINFVEGGETIHLPDVIEDRIAEYLKSKYGVLTEAESTPRLPNYYGVLLDDESQKFLRGLITLPGEGYKLFCHHMTIIVGRDFGSNKELVEWCQANISKPAVLRITGFGQDRKAIAIKVKTNVPSLNTIKHVTLATSPIGKPRDSGAITNWGNISNDPLYLHELHGTIQGLM